MIKSLILRKAILAPAMLLLCGIFLQSCTEEMPILTQLSKSTNGNVIILNIKNKAYTLKNVNPGFVYFTNITAGGSANSSFQQYGLAGSNGNETNPLDCIINFDTDSVHVGKYVLSTSQVNYNNVTYTTSNASGNAKFTVNQLNATTNTTSGSFAYYLYDSVFVPTDSIYVSGTFNIVK